MESADVILPSLLLVTRTMIARIQSASSEVRFAALPFQKATLVLMARGCPFRSFFLWFAEGPTEFVRGGSVIETPRVFVPEPGPGVAGDEAQREVGERVHVCEQATREMRARPRKAGAAGAGGKNDVARTVLKRA